MNDFFHFVNVLPQRVYELHYYIPPFQNGLDLRNDETYNDYAQQGLREVFVNPVTKLKSAHDKLLPSLRRDYDFTIVERFGGPKNFHCTMSYMVARAIHRNSSSWHPYASYSRIPKTDAVIRQSA